MKKFLILFVMFLIAPLSVWASNDVKVLTLEATADGSTINYSGTTEDGSLAVMCKLYDDGVEVDLLSVAVDNNSFEGAFTVTGSGDYTVTCANYEGGEIKTTDVTVEEIVTTYTVIFNTDGGSAIENVSVTAGAKVTRPEDPTKEGFAFLGWYEDQTTTTVFDFDTEITGNLTLYAKWKQEPVAVHTIFFGQGGAYIVDFETDDSENQGPMAAPITTSGLYFVPANGEMTLTAVPSDGFSFRGWYRGNVDAQTPDEWVTDDLISTNTVYTFVPSGTPYIVPVFDDNRVFTVHFDTNGGSDIDDIQIHSGEKITSLPDVHKDWYDLAGWYEDQTLNIEFDFDTEITDNLTLYAKWVLDDNHKIYTVSDNSGNSISFVEEKGHEFTLAFIDISKLSDEELAELTDGELNREQYNEAEALLKESVKDNGTFIAVYEIVVVNENNAVKEMGPFTIRIKKTDNMEKFNNFKLLYVDTDNGFNVEETIDLFEDENGCLVGTLQHLSTYVLVGNEIQTANNPQTFDSIYVWVIALIVSIIGLILGFVLMRKMRKTKVK